MHFEFKIAEPKRDPRWVRLRGDGGEFGSGTLYLGWYRCKELAPKMLRRAQRELEDRGLLEHIETPDGPLSFQSRPLPVTIEVVDCRLARR